MDVEAAATGKEKYNDPLTWWCTMHTRFPILWRLAQVYLAIPATSVPSETAFSHAGHIVTPHCSQLKPETVSDLLLLNRNGCMLDDIQISTMLFFITILSSHIILCSMLFFIAIVVS